MFGTSEACYTREVRSLASQFKYMFHFYSTRPLPCSRAESLEQTCLGWQTCRPVCGVRVLKGRRLISMWLKLAELPYQASSQRKKEKGKKKSEAIRGLVKRQRYHMITVTDCYKSPILVRQKLFREQSESASSPASQNKKQTVFICAQKPRAQGPFPKAWSCSHRFYKRQILAD